MKYWKKKRRIIIRGKNVWVFEDFICEIVVKGEEVEQEGVHVAI